MDCSLGGVPGSKFLLIISCSNFMVESPATALNLTSTLIFFNNSLPYHSCPSPWPLRRLQPPVSIQASRSSGAPSSRPTRSNSTEVKEKSLAADFRCRHSRYRTSAASSHDVVLCGLVEQQAPADLQYDTPTHSVPAQWSLYTTTMSSTPINTRSIRDQYNLL